MPGAMLTFSMLWAPNCDYWRGLSFFFLFPIVTGVFSVSLAYALASRGRRFLFQVVLGILVLIAGPIYDIGLHPQFYTYNHIFGGVLGPIYDEALEVRPGLYSFRLLTLLWAGLFYCVAEFSVRRHARAGFGAFALLIGAAYLFAAQLGMNTPEWYLRSQFSGHRESAHFDIHYDAVETDSATVEHWVIEHEYRYDQLARQLETEVTDRIQSYIYPDEEIRAVLTGARFTSVSPVWLASPQVHVLAAQVGSVFPHELAHVFSREFGLPIIRASFSIGLVEGLAVATQPPDGRPSPDEMVTASGMLVDSNSLSMSARIASTLSPFGFWTGRGGVSYTVMGSFVRFLMGAYGVGPLKRVYRSADFEDVYGKTVEGLAEEWIVHLRKLNRIDIGAARRAKRRFSVPSLIERICPHWVPPDARRHARAGLLFGQGNVDGAIREWLDLLEDYPDFEPARTGWVAASLAKGMAGPALSTLAAEARDKLSAEELILVGDAYALSAEPDAAMLYYATARERYPVYARDARARLTLRAYSSTDSELVRIFVTADSASERLEGLDHLVNDRSRLAGEKPWRSAFVWRALMLARAERFADASEALDRARSVWIQPGLSAAEFELMRQFDVWTAAFAYRIGDNDRALAYAESAMSAFRNVGDLNTALMMEDFANRLRWLRSGGADSMNLTG